MSEVLQLIHIFLLWRYNELYGGAVYKLNSYISKKKLALIEFQNIYIEFCIKHEVLLLSPKFESATLHISK